MASGIAAGSKRMELDKIFGNLCILSLADMGKLVEQSTFGSEQEKRRSEFLFTKAMPGREDGVALEDVFKATRG